MQNRKADKEIIMDGVLFVIGVFLYALCFNLFLIPNDLVVSGFSGVAIVFQRLFNWSPSLFIYIMNGLLLLICPIFWDGKQLKKILLVQ